jgi:hypothetical protein
VVPRGSSWRRETLLVLLSIAGGLVLLAAILAGLQLWWHLHRTTVGDVERLIEAHLAPGAGTQEIFAFLESEGIEHGAVGRAGDSCCYLQDAGISDDTLTISAIMQDTSRSIFIFTGDIQIYFILDSEGRMKEYLVREVYTGF